MYFNPSRLEALPRKDFIPWLLMACGTFGWLGSALDWSFFMESRKAQFFVRLIGRGGARVFHVALGLALVTFGIGALLGCVDQTSGRR